MAIQESIENEYGVMFNYHKIREARVINDDKAGVQLVIDVYSWVDKDARINGKEPVIRRCIIHEADFALTPFYKLLKAKFPDYSAGLDDFDNSFKATMKEKRVPQFVEQTITGNLIKRWKENEEEKSE